MLAIGDFASNEGVAYPSIKSLADRTKISERAIQYMLHRLVRSGELDIQRGKGPRGCNLFRVQTVHPVQTVQVQELLHPGCKKGGFGGARAIAPDPSGTNTKKEKKNAPDDPRRAPFIAHVFESRPDLITDSSDFNALKQLLTRTKDKPQFSIEKLRDYWARFLNSPDKFHRNQGKPLRFFCTNINTFVVMDGKAGYSEAEIEAAEKRHQELYKGKLR